MKSKAISVGVLLLLSLSFFLPIAGAAIISSTTRTLPTTSTVTTSASTTTDQCIKSLCGTLNAQNQTFDPSKQPNYFGTDLGKFSTQTDPDGFVWSTGSNDFLIMGLPTVGSTSFVGNRVLYFNSSHTAYKFSGAFGSLNVFFKPAQYKVKISIEANLVSPQSVCLPFTSGNPIVPNNFVNATQRLFSIRAGNQIFNWADVPLSFSPTFSTLTNSLCLSLPIGITNIDPIALDGSGICQAVTSCSVSLTTANANDVIIVGAMSYSDVISTVADTSSLTYTQHSSYIVAASLLHIYEYSAIAASALSGDSVTCTWVTSVSTNVCVVFGISGANTGTPFDPNGGLPCKNEDHTGTSATMSCTFSTNNANDFIYGIGTNYENSPVNSYTAGTGFTIIRQIGNTNGGTEVGGAAEYQVVSSTQSSVTAQMTINIAGRQWAFITDAIQAAITNQPIVLVLKVNPSPSPQGGDIVASCIAVVFTCNVVLSTTTISASLAWTVSTSSTITIMANEFSGYIQGGWSGAIALIADTVNPTQIVSITSFTTTTQSSTLTANFVTPGAASSGNFFAVTVLGAIVVGFMLIALIASRRR